MSQIEDQVIPQFLLERTKHIRFASSYATGFLHNDSSFSYLITVRHLFQATKTKRIINGRDTSFIKYDSILVQNNGSTEIEVYDENKWIKLKGTISYFRTDSCNIDLAIFKFYKTGTWNSIYFNDQNNFFFGQRCYYAGYPLGLKTPSGGEIGFSLPIIKTAIFSGVTNDTASNQKALLLDGNNTFGLSGSPIFYYDYYIKKWRISGMVTSYYIQRNKTFNYKTGKFEIQEENSGIIRAVFSSDINKLLLQIK